MEILTGDAEVNTVANEVLDPIIAWMERNRTGILTKNSPENSLQDIPSNVLDTTKNNLSNNRYLSLLCFAISAQGYFDNIKLNESMPPADKEKIQTRIVFNRLLELFLLDTCKERNLLPQESPK